MSRPSAIKAPSTILDNPEPPSIRRYKPSPSTEDRKPVTLDLYSNPRTSRHLSKQNKDQDLPITQEDDTFVISVKGRGATVDINPAKRDPLLPLEPGSSQAQSYFRPGPPLTDTPLTDSKLQDVEFSTNQLEGPAYNTSKPTCTINLVCYRSGAGGCVMRQIQAVKRDRFEDEASFRQTFNDNRNLLLTDRQFFFKLRSVYLKEMCGFWRRAFSLKTLSRIRLLSVCLV
jgi:hypothetical protein